MVVGADERGRSVDATSEPVRLGLRAVAGIRFAGEPQEVLDRTMDPPDSWAVGPDGATADRRGARSGGEGPLVARLAERVFPSRPGTPGGGPLAELDDWLAAGVVVRDQPTLYVYRRTETSGPRGAAEVGDTRSTRGLLGALDLSGRSSAVLLPHEGVRPALVLAQRELAERARAQLDPVVAFAGPPGAMSVEPSPLAQLLDRLTAVPPSWSAVDGPVVHELWSCTDQAELRAAAEVPVGTLVVADGHHRRRAWSAGEGAPWGLVWVVDSAVEPLRLEAVHRLCPGLRLQTVLDSPLVRAEPLGGPEDARRALDRPTGSSAVVHDGDRWLLVRPAEDAPDPGCVLPDHPLCRLHDQWLPAWGVAEAAVEHVHGFGTAAALARHDRSAVLLPAAPLSAVEDAARAGTVLPAKATSFVPKARVGLVMRHWQRPGDDVLRTGSWDGSAGTG